MTELKSVTLLPEVTKLTNEDFAAIALANNRSERVTIQGHTFDGTAQILPSDISALYSRIAQPDQRSNAIRTQLDGAQSVYDLTAAGIIDASEYKAHIGGIVGKIERLSTGGAVQPDDFKVPFETLTLSSVQGGHHVTNGTSVNPSGQSIGSSHGR